MITRSSPVDDRLVTAVREFVEGEVRPTAGALEHADRYPETLVARMRELGLFGALVPAAYGGLGLSVTTYARVIEELCRGFMSLAGVINSHTMLALIVRDHGTEEQRRRFLPRLARGEARGGLCLTEPQAGSDVQAIRTLAIKRGEEYLITGTKMFVTNGREGNAFALLALTDPRAEPRHRGMSCFVVEKGHPGLRVAKSISKLGYKGVDTAELVFEDFPVPAASLVGGREGLGFGQVMSALETGRINIAARAVGVAQAAFDEARARVRADVGRAATAETTLADMASRLGAARLLTYWAAGMKDRGERADLEAGMAKLWASETAQAVAADALRVHGPAGTLAASPVERHYRDTPLMIIGEGTNEIQRLVIARHLLERGGEGAGALASREREPDERRQMVLAVRQFVDKSVAPLAAERDRDGRYPVDLLRQLGELGVLGAIVPQEDGGLALDLPTYAMLVEELARGSAALATGVAAHLTAAHAVARFGTASQRERLLPAMARGDVLGATALADPVTARRERDDWVLHGTCPLVANAERAGLIVVGGRTDAGSRAFLLAPEATGVRREGPLATLGVRGLGVCALHLDGARVHPGSLLGNGVETTLALARLGVAAAAVGLAQAAFEAALRYSQERSTFGKPICQHQAIQLKLADMATRLTAARLLTGEAARRFEGAAGLAWCRMAKIHASEMASDVALEAMRIHGGYGYTTEFPVERYYRDAAQLALSPVPNDRDRLDLGRLVADGAVL